MTESAPGASNLSKDEAVTPDPGRLLDLQVAAMTLVVGFWCATSLLYPSGIDQGIFSWIGDVILSGGMPYRDAWDLKGPAVYYLFALGRLVSGHAEWGYRLVDLGFTLAGALACRRLGERLTGRTGGLWAPPFYVALLAAGGFWATAQPSAWCATATAWYLVWLLSGTPRSRLAEALVGGLWLAFLVTLKLPYLAFLPLVPAGPLLVGGRPWRTLVVPLLGSLGVACLLLVAVGAWLHGRGALVPLVEIYRQFVFGGYSTLPGYLPSRLAVLAGLLVYWSGIPFPPLILLLAASRIPPERRGEAGLMALWAGLGLAIVIAQGRFFVYHFNILLPPVAVLLAATATPPGERGRGWTRVVAACLGLLVVPPLADAMNATSYALGMQDRASYLRFLMGDRPSHDYQGLTAASTWIGERAAPEDRLFVWGHTALPLALTGLRGVGRFGAAYPLIFPQNPPVRDAYRDEFWEAFQRDPPRFVILQRFDFQLSLAPRELLLYLPGFPRLDQELSARYQVQFRSGNVLVLVRLPATSPGPLE